MCLEDNDLGPEEVKRLRPAFKSLSNLQVLDLSNNNIYSEGLEILASVFPDIKDLRILDLRRNRLTSDMTGDRREKTEKGLTKLAQNLKFLKKLEVLDLRLNFIEHQEGIIVVGALEDAPNLRALHLSSFKFCPESPQIV